MKIDIKREPAFRTEKKDGKILLFLLCSECGVDIREIKPHESIKVTQAYYCPKCDPGVTILNPPHTPDQSSDD